MNKFINSLVILTLVILFLPQQEGNAQLLQQRKNPGQNQPNTNLSNDPNDPNIIMERGVRFLDYLQGVSNNGTPINPRILNNAALQYLGAEIPSSTLLTFPYNLLNDILATGYIDTVLRKSDGKIEENRNPENLPAIIAAIEEVYNIYKSYGVTRGLENRIEYIISTLRAERGNQGAIARISCGDKCDEEVHITHTVTRWIGVTLILNGERCCICSKSGGICQPVGTQPPGGQQAVQLLCDCRKACKTVIELVMINLEDCKPTVEDLQKSEVCCGEQFTVAETAAILEAIKAQKAIEAQKKSNSKSTSSSSGTSSTSTSNTTTPANRYRRSN